ncbi:MAG: hypothetical protein KGH87_00970 [Thaumarchaeota archaeon]|nr:hypothetical protein [Nitrososphaerota archaeon]
MKTIPLLIIMISSASLGMVDHNVFADSTVAGVTVINLQVDPPIIKVGNTFTVSATLVNNSTHAIYVQEHACRDFFSIFFDNHATSDTKGSCIPRDVVQTLNPGQQIRTVEPSSNLIYTATSAGITNATVTFSYLLDNQTASSLTGDQKMISKSFMFTIYDRNATISMVHQPPLQQIRSGIAPNEIKCDNLVLAIKKEDNTPACILPDDLANLVIRGWAVNPMSSLLATGYSTQVQQDKFFYDVMNLAPLRQWSKTGWKFTGGNYIGNDKYDIHFSQLGLYLPPNSGNPKLACDKGWYAFVGIDTRKLVIYNATYPVGSDCGNMGSVTFIPSHQIICDQNCKNVQESRGMLCYKIDKDDNNYCIPKENNMTQILILPALITFERYVTPQTVTVQIGVNNTVQWTNADDSMYAIVGDKGQFRSNSLTTNQTWVYTFDNPGTYGYHGEPGPWLRGQVIVLPADNFINSTRGK